MFVKTWSLGLWGLRLDSPALPVWLSILAGRSPAKCLLKSMALGTTLSGTDQPLGSLKIQG